MKEFAITPAWDGKTPLYQQLYRCIVEEIRAGRLKEGDKLPSRRALCAHLGVSMSTVEGAYGLLTAEGYVRAIPRSGYRVCPVLTLDEAPHSPPPRAETPPKEGLKECFSTSAVDTSVFPFASWSRLLREAAREPALLGRGDGQGEEDLREALCAFLRQYRGVVCRKEQVVIGAGMEYLLSLLFQLFPAGVPVGLESPGYLAPRRALESQGRRWVPLPLDGEGLRPDALPEGGAAVVCVTPSHQFPTGVTMPTARRSALLRWAYAAPGRYLVEDDYDSDFRFSSRPLPALQGLDGGERVVYAGTFSRSIAPSIRAAYLVLPPSLLEGYRERFSRSASTVSRFEQHALGRFLASGQYQRHLRRMSALYRSRCAALISALERHFPQGEILGGEAGLHLLLTLPGREDGELSALARRGGYAVHTLSEYCLGPSPRPGTLVLGFAGLPEEEAEEAASGLEAAFNGKRGGRIG